MNGLPVDFSGTWPLFARDSPALRLTALAALWVCSATQADSTAAVPTSERDIHTNLQETQTVEIEGDRLSGFVLPMEPIKSDLVLSCRTARRWTVDDTQRLLLSGDVNIDLGSYAFAADSAIIWINRLPSEKGLVNQMAIWFPPSLRANSSRWLWRKRT